LQIEGFVKKNVSAELVDLQNLQVERSISINKGGDELLDLHNLQIENLDFA